MNTILAIYLAGVAIGLLRTDGSLTTRLLLSVLWPLGPIAFIVTIAILLAATPIAFLSPRPRRT
jgi:hypothetical protein